MHIGIGDQVALRHGTDDIHEPPSLYHNRRFYWQILAKPELDYNMYK